MIQKILSNAFVLVVIALASVLPPTTANAESVGGANSVTIVQSDDQQVIIRVKASDGILQRVPDSVYSTVVAQNTQNDTKAGLPVLPYISTLVALPPERDAYARVLESDCQLLSGSWRIQPASNWGINVTGPDRFQQLSDSSQPWSVVTEENPDVYGSSSFFPSDLVQLGETQNLRGYRLLSLRFNAWQTAPASGFVRNCSDILVQIRFSQAATLAVEPNQDAAYESLLSDTVINWEQARHWQIERAQPSIFSKSTQNWTSGVRIIVNPSGINRLSYQALAAAGVPVTSVDPTTFQMTWRDQEISIDVPGEGDHQFDPTDEIRFYAFPERSRYTTTSVYWLRWGIAAGARMALRDVTPSGSAPETSFYTRTLHLEQQQKYRSEAPVGKDEDHWFFDEVYARPGATRDVKSYAFLTSDALGQPGVQIKARLMGGQSQTPNPDNWTRIWLNGHKAGTFSWDGMTMYTATSYLQNVGVLTTTNTLTVEADLTQIPGVTAYWINPDWYEISYPARMIAANGKLDVEKAEPGLRMFSAGNFTNADLIEYDVSNPLHPVRFTGSAIAQNGSNFTTRFETEGERFFITQVDKITGPVSLTFIESEDLRDPALGADYIMIGPRGFLNTAQPVLNQRQAQGLRVKAVDIQDIFDQFSGGYREPQAIRDFLTYAYHHWTAPAPTYVVLLGDGHYDFRNDTGYNYPNPVPPYLLPVDPYIGETVSDNRLVAVDGENDILPDMNIGRLPVNNAQEVQDVVNKLLAYSTASPGIWQRESTYAADLPDTAGNFHAISDEIRSNWLSKEMISVPIYVGTPSFPAQLGTLGRDALVSAWQNGEFMTQWFGHGSRYRWGFSSSRRMMSTLHEPNLPVQSKLPLIVEWGCWTGYFIVVDPPNQPTIAPNLSLGEMLMRTPNKGAIADISATGLHIAPPLQIMAHGLHEALFTNREKRVGIAYTAMKFYFFAHSQFNHDAIDTTVLFGDPALQLHLPEGDLSTSSLGVDKKLVLPTDTLNYTVAVTNTSLFTVTKPIVSAKYPSQLTHPVNINNGINSGQAINWSLPDIPPGGSVELNFSLGINESLPIGSHFITIPVSIGSQMALTVTREITSMLIVTPNLLTSAGFVQPNQAHPGEPLHYTLQLTNSNPFTATNLTVIADYDEQRGVIFSPTNKKALHTNDSPIDTNGKLTWENVSIGQTQRFLDFHFKLKSVLDPGVKVFGTPVSIYNQNELLYSFIISATVDAQPVFSTSKMSASPIWVKPGNSITISANLENTGTSFSPNASFSLPLPLELSPLTSYTSTIPTIDYVSDVRQLNWLGALNPNSPVTVFLTTKLDPFILTCGQLSISGNLFGDLGTQQVLSNTINFAVPDVNCDGTVNIVDIQLVSARWGESSTSLLYEERYDSDADGVIGISDLVYVADAWK